MAPARSLRAVVSLACAEANWARAVVIWVSVAELLLRTVVRLARAASTPASALDTAASSIVLSWVARTCPAATASPILTWTVATVPAAGKLRYDWRWDARVPEAVMLWRRMVRAAATVTV